MRFTDPMRVFNSLLFSFSYWKIGPLLWHFENSTTGDLSIELDLDEVKEVARKIGFEIHNERRIDTIYTGNTDGMLSYVYHTAFWTATKI